MTQIGRSYATDRAIASSEEVDGPTLTQLASSLDKETRRQVLLNVSVPLDLMLSLAAEFPYEFLSHPMLDLALLEDPELYSRVPPGVLRNALADEDCPESMILWVCRNGHRQDQATIMKRPDLKLSWLRLLSKGRHPRIAEAALAQLIALGEP